jgi:hypothetical protein
VRTFQTAFTTEKNKKTGAKPVWIIRLTVGGVDYFLANKIITIPAFTGSLPWPVSTVVTTKKWPKSWGTLQEGITNSLAEFQTAEYSFDAIIDPDVTPNMETLCTQYDIEESPVELFLWFNGCTDPPQIMFSGFVNDVQLPSNTYASLSIKDDGIKLERTYIGTKLDSATYPLADPDDIGKVIPIPFGAVEKLKALCVDSGWVTSLVAAIDDVQTVFNVSEVAGVSLAGKTITIDDEEMYIVSGGLITGNNYALPIAGYGSTASSSAPRAAFPASNMIDGTGFACITDASPSYPVTMSVSWTTPVTIDTINVMFRDGATWGQTDSTYAHRNFTIDVSNDNGSTWSNVATQTTNNKTWFQTVFSSRTINKMRIVLNTSRPLDTLANVQEFEAINSTTPYNTITKTLTVTRAQNSTDAAIHGKASVVIEKKSTPLVYLCSDVPVTSINNIFARIRGLLVDITSDCTSYINVASGDLGGLYIGKAAITIPDIADVSKKINIQLENTLSVAQGSHSHVTTSSAGLYNFDGSTIQSSSVKYTRSAAVSGTGTPVKARIKFIFSFSISSDSAAYTVYLGGVLAAQGTFRGTDTSPVYSPDFTVTSWADLSASGFFVNISHAGPSYTVTPSFEVYTGAAATAAPATGVALLGTLNLTGNSVSDIMIGDAVLVNLTHNVTAPDAVIDYLLTNYCSNSTLALTGAFPASYSFNGAITDYEPALRVINKLALQCRSYFKMSRGIARLIFRETSTASAKSIPSIRITNDGRLVLSRQKTATTEVINKINLQYLLDYSKGKSSTSYTATAMGNDTASQAIYGVQEQSTLFNFDFIKDSIHAADLKDFYVAKYKDRHWIHAFDVFLDNCELEFNDYVTLAFLPDAPVGQVIRSEYHPGDSSRNDTVRLTVLV